MIPGHPEEGELVVQGIAEGRGRMRENLAWALVTRSDALVPRSVLAPTSKALVTTSVALVPSFLLLLVRSHFEGSKASSDVDPMDSLWI